MSLMDKANAVAVTERVNKSLILNTAENITALAKAIEKRYGEINITINSRVMLSGGLNPDGTKRVPLAVVLRSKPGGSVVCWTDRQDPGLLSVVWSGVMTDELLKDAKIQTV